MIADGLLLHFDSHLTRRDSLRFRWDITRLDSCRVRLIPSYRGSASY